MCFLEVFAVIPEGCLAEPKHTHLGTDGYPCLETFYLQIAKHAEAGGTPQGLTLTLCEYKDWVKIDCFHRELEVRALQFESPYCPICSGEKTLAQAMTPAESESTNFAVLLDGSKLNNLDNPITLPTYAEKRDWFTRKKTSFDPIHVKTKVGDKWLFLLPNNKRGRYTDPDDDAKFKTNLKILLKLCYMGDEEFEAPPDMDLAWLESTLGGD